MVGSRGMWRMDAGVESVSSDENDVHEHRDRNTRGGEGVLTADLRAPPQVRQEVIVIQSPHTMAPSRLQLIHILEFPDKAQVPIEDF